MATSEQRVQERIQRVRRRLRGLDRYIPFRRGRTLYWRRKADRETDPDLRGIYRRRERDSAHLGREARRTEKILRAREQAAVEKLEFLREQAPLKDADGDGIVMFDGKPVSADVGRELQRFRTAGRWKGALVSGYRTPEYSEQLCFNMCGAARCPGRCAGRATNHARKGPRQGAADVSDFYTFRAECQRLGSWLENRLPYDLVHFSDSGV